MRKSLAWLLLIIPMIVAVIVVKQHAQDTQRRIATLQRQILQTEENIKMLQMEWIYLTRPTRLEELNRRHLRLEISKAEKIGNIDIIPLAGRTTIGEYRTSSMQETP